MNTKEFFLAEKEKDVADFNKGSTLDFSAANHHSSTIEPLLVIVEQAKNDQSASTSRRENININSFEDNLLEPDDVGNDDRVCTGICPYFTFVMNLFLRFISGLLKQKENPIETAAFVELDHSNSIFIGQKFYLSINEKEKFTLFQILIRINIEIQ